MNQTPVNIQHYEDKAKALLQQEIFDFYAGGSLDENTLQKNTQAFSEIFFVPRVMRDVSECKTETDFLGLNLSLPLISAPMALQCLAYPEGEVAMARALSESGLASTISTMSSFSLEHIQDMTACQAWFQLYIFRDRNITLDLIQRAESSGYKGIVLTVDVPIMARRERDIRNNFRPPDDISFGNFINIGLGLKSYSSGKPIIDFVKDQFDRSITWKDISWIKANTSLPLILKGIAHPKDVTHAIEHNIDAIIISNHGGRQLDQTLSSIELLKNIMRYKTPNMPVLMDGGIRRGGDILKALLLGADAVLVGRPLLWGLAVNGEKGVKDVVSILKHELLDAMMLTGISDIADISNHMDVLYDPC